MFSTFRHSLSQLSLSYCDITISAFVTLINYFPNLSRVDLHRLLHVVDGKPAPPLSRRLLGQLHISGVYVGDFGSGFLDRLSELGLTFDEIVFTEPRSVCARTVERVVDAVGVSVKRLRLLDRLEYSMYITLQAEPTARLTKLNTKFL